MATANAANGTSAFDSAFEQFKDAGDQFTATARKAGNLYLDSYEQAVDRAIDLELRFAGLTKQDWLKSVIEAQAEIARDIAGAYTSAARLLLK
jgi:hypothetical protein